jgi:integrase
MKAAEGDWRGAILFGYFTGARLGDIANMRWSAIDLDKGLIRVLYNAAKACAKTR